jgi:NOL1/NOP2/sun family putative RNA methylase
LVDKLPKDFLSRMKKLMGEGYNSFLSSYHLPIRRGLRVNTLKCSIDRFSRIFPYSISQSPFCSEGFYLDDDLRAGADPLHHAGAYYMQEPSAMSAVTVLNPRPGERVLDFCAAPGGKSTQIAAALSGSGLLWSNEIIRNRANILAQNIERCGVRNAVISSVGADVLGKALAGFFDAVLVDAPCSGEGMFKKEPDAISHWSKENIGFCAERQTEILISVADTVKQGGRLVYSTCTFAPEENEIQIARFLNMRPDFELVDIGDSISFGRPGFSWDQIKGFWSDSTLPPFPLEYTRRVFPNDGGEGHFIALMRRTSVVERPVKKYNYNIKDTNIKLFEKLYKEIFSGNPYGIAQTIGDTIRLLPDQLPSMKGLGEITAGVEAAKLLKNRLEPCHAIFMAAKSDECDSILDLRYNDPRLTAFLKGEQVEATGCSGWTAVAVEGVITGYGKVTGGILKNKYPKGLRLRTGL